MPYLHNVILLFLFCFTISLSAAETNVKLPMFPSLSPDGNTLVFTWRGDLWKINLNDESDQATRLTTHPATEYRTTWSPDGSKIAFNSLRTGYPNIYTMNSDGTNVQQVTADDQYYILNGWGKNQNDKSVITFYARDETENYRGYKPYAVEPKESTHHLIHKAFGSRPNYSPNGKRVVFTRGSSSNYRRHYRGPDNRNLWLYNTNHDRKRHQC